MACTHNAVIYNTQNNSQPMLIMAQALYCRKVQFVIANHSLPLLNYVMRQYRACVIDLLWLGIIVGGVCYCIMCTPILSALFLSEELSNLIYLSLFLCSAMIVESILGMSTCAQNIVGAFN